MTFLDNISQNIGNEIANLLESADEVLIAVAFLKQSGLGNLMPALQRHLTDGKMVTIIAGRHYALTEPKALLSLHGLFSNNSNAKLLLAKAEKGSSVFHPKLYLFRQGDSCHIICGSANMTGGGLENNVECALTVPCSINDKAWQSAYRFFNSIAQPEYAEEATLLAIKKYEANYEQQRQITKAASAHQKMSTDAFDYERLNAYLVKIKKADLDKWYKDKVYHYEQARKVLDRIADHSSLTQAKFISLIEELVGKRGEKGWWHSGSLFRNKGYVFNHPKPFQKLVRFIRSNKNQSAATLYQQAVEQVSKIDGAGPNYVTEIMMTYAPYKFANLNANPIKVLKTKGGVYLKSTSSSFSGYDYEQYCQLIGEINTRLGFRSMLEADTFFNEIYWQIKASERAKIN